MRIKVGDEFESQLTEWFRARRPIRQDRVEGGWSVALIEEVGVEEAMAVKTAKAWQGELFEAGLVELEEPWEGVFKRVSAGFTTPDLRPLLIGLHILGPALRAFGSAAIKRKYLEPILRGELIACQLFSEPDAGSDLASIRTRAERVEGGWVVNGQKVWTSSAHLAEIGELLARTDADSSRHAGLSMFVLDMAQDGVHVRPLRQMTGGAAFNEVFLTDAFVPEENLIGVEGTGWQVAMTSLDGERAALGGEVEAVPPHLLESLIAMIQRRRLDSEPKVVIALAEAAVALFGHEAVVQYGRDDLQYGAAAASMSKIMVSRMLEKVTDAVLDTAGADALMERGTGADSEWSELILGKPAVAIAGGSDEIQKNLISERHLGLPKDRR